MNKKPLNIFYYCRVVLKLNEGKKLISYHKHETDFNCATFLKTLNQWNRQALANGVTNLHYTYFQVSKDEYLKSTKKETSMWH